MKDDGYTRITLRIPSELHARLSDRAARTSKSMNAEIVERLEQSFEGHTKSASHALRLVMERMKSLNAMIDALQGTIKDAHEGSDAILWSGKTVSQDKEAREKAIIEVKTVKRILDDELRQVMRFIPILVEAATDGRPVPGEVIDYLIES